MALMTTAALSVAKGEKMNVLITRQCGVLGKRVQPGDTVTLEKTDASSLIGMGKGLNAASDEAKAFLAELEAPRKDKKPAAKTGKEAAETA